MTTTKFWLRSLCLLLVVFPALLAPGPVSAQPAPATTAAQAEKAQDIPDVELLDQRGRPVRFHRDLVADRVVAIQFIFTSCRLACPLLGVQFGKLQELVGEKLDHGVQLISISVDPLTDRPERLAAWAEQFKARPGWTQVTGDRSEIETLLKALGAYTADKNSHTSFVLLIDAKNENWKRLDGFSSAAAIATEIDHLLAADRP